MIYSEKWIDKAKKNSSDYIISPHTHIAYPVGMNRYTIVDMERLNLTLKNNNLNPSTERYGYQLDTKKPGWLK